MLDVGHVTVKLIAVEVVVILCGACLLFEQPELRHGACEREAEAVTTCQLYTLARRQSLLLFTKTYSAANMQESNAKQWHVTGRHGLPSARCGRVWSRPAGELHSLGRS